MITKILSKLDTTKKKAGAIITCSALVIALGAGTVFAASSMNSLQVKMENGVRSYSADGGKSWSQNAPDGVVVSDKDGKLTITNGVPPKDGEESGMLSKMEDGVRYYSTDGGKTWSQNAPKGVTVNEDGSVIMKGDSHESAFEGAKTFSGNDGKNTNSNGIPPKDGEGNGVLSKMEDGVRYYSTDGGKTWTQNAPKNIK